MLRRDFPRESWEVVVQLLLRYTYREADRVRLATLKNANGDIRRLAQQIEWACMDYRDVLLSAEYPAAGRIGRLSELPERERETVYAADRAQYEVWFKRVDKNLP